MPPLEGGFYDIDITANKIVYTLIDNRSATNLLFPDGTFDRYYITMPAMVTSVSLVSSDSIVATVEVLEEGTSEMAIDVFGTGLVFPESFGGSTIKVQIIGGTDLTELGQEIVIEYTLDGPTEMMVCGSGPLTEEMVTSDSK